MTSAMIQILFYSLGNIGRISWVNNFVAFMDNMLQMQILQEDTRGLFVPTSIQKMVINTKKHFNILHSLDEEKPGQLIHLLWSSAYLIFSYLTKPIILVC